MEVANACCAKQLDMVPGVEEYHSVVRFAREIPNHSRQRRAHMVRIGHKDYLWAIEGRYVPRHVRQTRIHEADDRVGLLLGGKAGHQSGKIIFPLGCGH